MSLQQSPKVIVSLHIKVNYADTITNTSQLKTLIKGGVCVNHTFYDKYGRKICCEHRRWDLFDRQDEKTIKDYFVTEGQVYRCKWCLHTIEIITDDDLETAEDDEIVHRQQTVYEPVNENITANDLFQRDALQLIENIKNTELDQPFRKKGEPKLLEKYEQICDEQFKLEYNAIYRFMGDPDLSSQYTFDPNRIAQHTIEKYLLLLKASFSVTDEQYCQQS